MKSRAAVHIGLATALSATLRSLSGGYMVAVIAVVAILALSALILCLHERFSNRLWKRLVRISANMDVGYTASGFGFSGVGISLLGTGWWPLGIMLLLVGASLLGIGLGANIIRGTNLSRTV